MRLRPILPGRERTASGISDPIARGAGESAEKIVKDIRRRTRRKFSAEEKIGIVPEGYGTRRPSSPPDQETLAGRGPHGIPSCCSSARSCPDESLAAIHAMEIPRTAHSGVFLQGTPSDRDALVHDRSAIRTEPYRYYCASVIVVGTTLPQHSSCSLSVLFIRSGRNHWPLAAHANQELPGEQVRDRSLPGGWRHRSSVAVLGPSVLSKACGLCGAG